MFRSGQLRRTLLGTSTKVIVARRSTCAAIGDICEIQLTCSPGVCIKAPPQSRKISSNLSRQDAQTSRDRFLQPVGFLNYAMNSRNQRELRHLPLPIPRRCFLRMMKFPLVWPIVAIIMPRVEAAIEMNKECIFDVRLGLISWHPSEQDIPPTR